MKILVTGSAGFIGFHVSLALLKQGYEVVGIDNLNDYYDVRLKLARNKILAEHKNYKFYKTDLCELVVLKEIIKKEGIKKICHLAAQPGVRHSIDHPFAYQKANNEAFLNIIECARQFKIRQFVYASSSSVYGGNKKIPFAVEDSVDQPISLYAATKRANELVAHVYSHLYGINTIGLRFFTVYGPWGRPDMAYFLFTKAITERQPIKVFNHGEMKRNFTYIDDAVAGVLAALEYEGKYEVFNIGNDKTVKLMDFIACIERELGQEAEKVLLSMQPGDIKEIWAEIDSSRAKLNYRPQTDIGVGLSKFVAWYKQAYKRSCVNV